jgi:transcriptional regulator with XRE-family HTH domain
VTREPQEIATRRQQLGAMLATFRQAARLSQAQLGADTHYDRTSINKIEHGQQLPDRPFWLTADQLLDTRGSLVEHYDVVVARKREQADERRQAAHLRHLAEAQRLRSTRRAAAPAPGVVADNGFSSPAPVTLSFPATVYADTIYLEAVQQYIWHIVELDGRFGGTDLARLAVRFFRSVHQQLGTGAYEPAIERDLQAAAGELAEVAGWLLYDADRQDEVRRLNQEALYFSRLAGDRSMELLTLQNSSMHAGFLGRPREALQLACSVLESRDRLSPRVKTLFLTRKARALAQGGDEGAFKLFDQVRSHYQDGVRDNDPKWVWWVDERELAWHQGMAQLDLGNPAAAVDQFEHSIFATAPHQLRGRYLHLGYLLGAQAKVGAWHDAEATMQQLIPLVDEVASTRTTVLLGKILPKLTVVTVPASTCDTAEQLQLKLRGTDA